VLSSSSATAAWSVSARRGGAPSAIGKGRAAKKNLIRVPRAGRPDRGNFGAGSVVEARPDGTWASSPAVRAVKRPVSPTSCEAALDRPTRVVRATAAGLDSLKDPALLARMRGKEQRRDASDRRTDAKTRSYRQISEPIEARRHRQGHPRQEPDRFHSTQGTVVRSFGLRRIRHTVELGLARNARLITVRHLVTVSEA
jgi:ribosomal protein L30/L7E